MRSLALEKAEKDLRRKRLIKRCIREERRREPPPLSGTPTATIPIEIEDAGAHVFHALDQTDVRAVLQALPDAATEGIRCVRLALGARYIEDYVAREDPDWSRDPITGRYGAELTPGVFSPAVSGLYFPNDLGIHVHAYVLDRSRLVLPERACEFFLRLTTLGTLLHEIGHHHDFLRRRGRGRWLGDDDDACEAHADERALAWTRELVAPHLRRRDPQDVLFFLDWLEERGGVRLQLEDLLPGPNLGLFDFTAHRAVLDWLGELRVETGRKEARTKLVEWLIISGHHEPCLRALDGLEAEHPDDAEVLTLRADVLVHLEREEEALAIAEALRSRGVDSNDLWSVLCDALEALGEWNRLLDVCDRWCASRDRRSEPHRVVYDHRAVAYAALGDVEASERWLQAWAESLAGTRLAGPHLLEQLRRAVQRRSSRRAR